MDKLKFNLQLFADGGAGGAGGGDGGAAAGAGDATGVMAPAAEVQPRAKKRKENPLANVKYGKQMESAAPSQDATGMEEAANTGEEGQKRPTFQELIRYRPTLPRKFTSAAISSTKNRTLL